MKTISRLNLLILLFLAFTFSIRAQSPPYTSPDWADTIVRANVLNPNGDSSMFEVLPLVPSDRDAWFMHLWWTGDNGFSFAPTPKYNHMVTKGTIAKMTAITTENYGTGGPPPLTYTFTTEHQGLKTPKALGVDTFLHIQTYRNAVIDDTMYLIVSYGNPSNAVRDGKLKFDFGSYAEVCSGEFVANRHPDYLPNGESWDAGSLEMTFTNLGADEQRSVLIPVRIQSNRRAFLKMSASSEYNGIPNTAQSSVAPPVATSHDPNVMIAESDAIDNCDYRGGNIHYTVKFQNDGAARTNYVRVECHLDEKVDLNSIENVTVPIEFYPQGSWECNDSTIIIRRGYESGRGAAWDIDYDRRMLIVEMQDLRLYSSVDPNLPRIDMARAQIEFDVKVKDNYIFGKPVVAHSEIFFDSNAPISTNTVKTGCDQPVPLIKGGGFQSGTQPVICQWIWWIIGALLAIILFLIFRLIRSKRKRKKLEKELGKSA